MSLLRYTSHPFVDVGVATITVMSGKHSPNDVDVGDLERAAEQLKEEYSTLKKLRNHISSIFLNSWFVQPSKKEADRRAYADDILFAFRPERPRLEGIPCTFFPEKEAVIYAHRQHLPLLNGDGIRNFSASGSAGIPISGEALLAIHAMPLGCVKCGYLLMFHQLQSATMTMHDMTLDLARLNYERNRQAIHLMRHDPSAEIPNLGGYKRTRYVEHLLAAVQRANRRSADLQSITGYYFTNYGPKPLIEIVRLESTVTNFLDAVQQDAPAAWRQVVWQNWQLQKGESHGTLDGELIATRRNDLYEQLFDLPHNARSVLRKLSKARNWNLISIFLEEVMQMEHERIETYRRLGDKLTEYMAAYEGDAMGFYHQIARASKYDDFRRALRRAGERVLKAGEVDPLFTYDDFIMAFEHPSNGYSQWKLGRDLIAFRMLEMLAERGVDTSTITDDDTEEETD